MESPHRITKQRRVIMEELRGNSSHPTADELYRRVRRRLPRISLGTVYRNLELLSRSGLVRKLETGGGKMRFDGFAEPHYHIHCRHCGRVADLELSTLPDLEGLVSDPRGFRVTGHHLEFTGFCPRCRKDKQEQQPAASPAGKRRRKVDGTERI